MMYSGMRKVTVGETKTEILLQVPNMSIDIGVDMLSDDNFSEVKLVFLVVLFSHSFLFVLYFVFFQIFTSYSPEECEDLRQKVKDGLLRKLTIVELEHKAKSLHEDITNHVWISSSVFNVTYVSSYMYKNLTFESRL
ncbi:hypothetical protein RHGRI_031779 [Rhododendron griersonianum]|uniref:Uncharacterized protein n=1 Tax=Rhododendron griersonianum TaxID=479676 RepID=A0AAV6IF01_9ERIC|nr:hypothetical protein RHGRI_031779 [Rhododendron griersonianum]